MKVYTIRVGYHGTDGLDYEVEVQSDSACMEDQQAAVKHVNENFPDACGNAFLVGWRLNPTPEELAKPHIPSEEEMLMIREELASMDIYDYFDEE